MDINERIRVVMETHRLTAGQFAEKIGVQRSNVSHILSGRNRPGFEFLEKVLWAFPRVQADWLMTGRHSAAKEQSGNADRTVQQVEITVAPKESSKKVIKIVTFYSDFTFDTYTPNAE